MKTANNIEAQDLLIPLVSALQTLQTSRHLPPCRGGKNLLDNLLKLMTAFAANSVNVERMLPLLRAVIRRESDVVIWDSVYAAIRESILPSHLASSVQQTLWHRSTGSFANTSG